MTKRIKDDVGIILDHLRHDEKNHYQASLFRKHIYLALRRLAQEIGYHAN